MATQTLTKNRLTEIPEHTLDEALQQKGEPSTPAKGKDQHPFVENQPDNNNPDTEPDLGDNHGNDIPLGSDHGGPPGGFSGGGGYPEGEPV